MIKKTACQVARKGHWLETEKNHCMSEWFPFICSDKDYKYYKSPNTAEWVGNAKELTVVKGVMANAGNTSNSARVKHHAEEHLQEKNQVLQEEPLWPGAANCKDFPQLPRREKHI